MTIKIVYGPPPVDMERIEAIEPDEESCIREQEKQSPPKPESGLIS